jgi:hypothetical protein
MSVPHLKEKARQMGLREMLERRLETCDNEQVVVQIRHIFAKMDEVTKEEIEWHKQHKGQEQFIIDETDAEDDDEEGLNNKEGMVKRKYNSSRQGGQVNNQHVEKKQ